MEAAGILNSRIDECFKYGISYLEVIYGTPDRYQGSIQQAVDEIKKENALIDQADDIHAGVRIKIKDNANPEPQNENMHFSDFQAHYDRKKSSEHEYDYYPLRSFYTAHQVANELNCLVEYARNMAKTLDEKQAELKNIFNRFTGRNEATWYIYKSGSESIAKKWNEDKESVCQELRVLGATDQDVEAILKSFHTPLKENQKVKSRVSSMLTRIRKRILKNKTKVS